MSEIVIGRVKRLLNLGVVASQVDSNDIVVCREIG